MSDLEDENDLGRFGKGGEDDIRPIDIGGGAPRPQAPAGGGVSLPGSKMEAAAKAAKAAGVGTGVEVIAERPASEMFEEGLNRVVKGDYIDLLRKNPTLREIRIGAGWDQRMFEESGIDIDLSCFLLDRNGQTRQDADFVFYNNDTACDGAVKHTGDNRTGAGDGDDEVMIMDLNGVPFDVVRVNFVLSVYDEEFTKKKLDLVRDFYLRIVNMEDDHEILRHEIPDDIIKGHNVYLVGGLVREGPKWFFEVLGSPLKSGLLSVAKGYGIIIKEDTG